MNRTLMSLPSMSWNFQGPVHAYYFDRLMCETRKDSTDYPDALSIWAKKPVPFFRENLISDG